MVEVLEQGQEDVKPGMVDCQRMLLPPPSSSGPSHTRGARTLSSSRSRRGGRGGEGGEVGGGGGEAKGGGRRTKQNRYQWLFQPSFLLQGKGGGFMKGINIWEGGGEGSDYFAKMEDCRTYALGRKVISKNLIS